MNYTCKVCGQLIQLDGSIIPEGSTCPGCSIPLAKEKIRPFTVICPAIDCRLKSNRKLAGEPCVYCQTPLVEYTDEEKKKDEKIRKAQLIQTQKPSNLSRLFYILAAIEMVASVILAVVNESSLTFSIGISSGLFLIAIGSALSHLNYMAQERTDRLIKETLKD